MAFRFDLFDPLWAAGRLEFLAQQDKYHREEVEKCRCEMRLLKEKLALYCAKNKEREQVYGLPLRSGY